MRKDRAYSRGTWMPLASCHAVSLDAMNAVDGPGPIPKQQETQELLADPQGLHVDWVATWEYRASLGQVTNREIGIMN